MQCVTVVYANKPDAKFDFDYYLTKHVPMVASFFGTRIEVQKGVASPLGGAVAFVCIARIWVNSADHFKATMEKHGEKILSDIRNYTNIEPVVQVDEVVRER